MSEHTQAVWEEVRRRKEFTAREIADALGLPHAAVGELLWGLSSSECVVCHGKRPSDVYRADTRWSLRNDIGPLAPNKIEVSFWLDLNSGRAISCSHSHRILQDIGVLEFLPREDMPAPPRPAEEVARMQRMMVGL